jgi:hypothetical protein
MIFAFSPLPEQPTEKAVTHTFLLSAIKKSRCAEIKASPTAACWRTLGGPYATRFMSAELALKERRVAHFTIECNTWLPLASSSVIDNCQINCGNCDSQPAAPSSLARPGKKLGTSDCPCMRHCPFHPLPPVTRQSCANYMNKAPNACSVLCTKGTVLISWKFEYKVPYGFHVK